MLTAYDEEDEDNEDDDEEPATLRITFGNADGTGQGGTTVQTGIPLAQLLQGMLLSPAHDLSLT